LVVDDEFMIDEISERKYLVGIVVSVGLAAILAIIISAAAINGHDPVWIDANNSGVFDAGEWNGTSIQAAIDNATPGQTIYVGDGIYEENVVVDKSVTLRADSSPVIDAKGGVGITVNASDSVVQDMTVTNASLGILVHNTSTTVTNVTLFNNTITDTLASCASGIEFENVTGSAIIECAIENINNPLGEAFGLYLRDADYNNVTDLAIGDITGASGALGLKLEDATYNNVSHASRIGNITSTDDGAAYGLRLSDSDNNTITAPGFGELTGINGAHGVYLDQSNDHNTITIPNGFGNIIGLGGWTSGVYLRNSDNNNVTSNGCGNITTPGGVPMAFISILQITIPSRRPDLVT
jgi:hypothetical protein